jgi:hypothetical protein
MKDEFNAGEVFKTAKNFEVGAFYRSNSGTVTLLLGRGVSINSDGERTIVSVDGVEREANGLFINKIDDTIQFLTGREGTADSIERLRKRQAKGFTSLLKVKLGE